MADMRTITDSDEKERRNLKAEVCRLNLENAELADRVDLLAEALAQMSPERYDPRGSDPSNHVWVCCEKQHEHALACPYLWAIEYLDERHRSHNELKLRN